MCVTCQPILVCKNSALFYFPGNTVITANGDHRRMIGSKTVCHSLVSCSAFKQNEYDIVNVIVHGTSYCVRGVCIPGKDTKLLPFTAKGLASYYKPLLRCHVGKCIASVVCRRYKGARVGCNDAGDTVVGRIASAHKHSFVEYSFSENTSCRRMKQRIKIAYR